MPIGMFTGGAGSGWGCGSSAPNNVVIGLCFALDDFLERTVLLGVVVDPVLIEEIDVTRGTVKDELDFLIFSVIVPDDIVEDFEMIFCFFACLLRYFSSSSLDG